MDGQGGNQNGRQEHNVQHIQPLDNIGARELIPEEEVGHPHAHHGESLDHAVNNP